MKNLLLLLSSRYIIFALPTSTEMIASSHFHNRSNVTTNSVMLSVSHLTVNLDMIMVKMINHVSYLCRLKCPPGHWCTEGTRTQFEHPCPAGTFNKETGLEREDQCMDCLPGYYCPAGDQYGDRLCPAGHYCLYKTGGPNDHPCDAGTYTEEQGSQSNNLMHFFVYKNNSC